MKKFPVGERRAGGAFDFSVYGFDATGLEC